MSFGRNVAFTFINWPERAALDSQTMAKPHVVNKLWISFSTEHTARCAELSGNTVNILIINSLLLISLSIILLKSQLGHFMCDLKSQMTENDVLLEKESSCGA